MKKDSVLAALPSLTVDELIAVQTVCASLLKAHTGALPAQADAGTIAIFNALAATSGACISLDSLSPTLRKAFDNKVLAFTSFLDKGFKGWDNSRVSQYAFLRSMFDLLKANLIAIGLNPSLTLLINHLHRMPQIIDDAYPGYIWSGVGDLILRHFQNDRMVKKAEV
jgi:hypothetical protein